MGNSQKEQATSTIATYDYIGSYKSVDNSVIFSLNGDYVLRHTPMPECGNNICKSEKVMDKETFIKCYEKWVAPYLKDKDGDDTNASNG